jgi:YD repeat-containing protein
MAIVGNTYHGFTNQAVQFNGNSSFDPDGDTITFQWDFGDASTGTGATPSHTYSTAGTYTVNLTVTDSQSATDGDSTSAIIVAAPAPTPTPTPASTGNNATFVSQSVPSTMTAGQPYSVTVTMRNTGTTTWTSAHLYRLGSQNPQDNGDWGSARVFLPADVSPGADAAFTFTVAPLAGATHRNFQWRMVQDGVEWFGGYSANQDITISSPATPPSYTPMDHYSARLEPRNRTGGSDDLLSRNFSWSVPVLGLAGRAGMDLGLSLSYNSLVWTRVNNAFIFDTDRGFPGAGFRLGFPAIQPQFTNSQAGTTSYLLIAPSGGRIELRQVSTGVYESVNSSYLQLIENGAGGLLLRDTSGGQMTYLLINGEYRCTSVKDRNGNYLTIKYDPINGTANFGRISSIIDTLGRTITFNYDSNYRLQTITQVRDGQTHAWASFGYDSLTVQPNFSGGSQSQRISVQGLPANKIISVLTQVGLDDGSRYNFDYTSWGQVWRVRHLAADGHQLGYTSYNLPLTNSTSRTDCPRFTERRDWAENWNGESEAVTTFTYNPEAISGNNTVWNNVTWAEATLPDGTKYRDYATLLYDQWQRGLVTKTEVYSADNPTTPKKTSLMDWTQDLTSVGYRLNPRVTAVTVSDSDGNRSRTTIECAAFGLPFDVFEWGPVGTNGWTLLRRAHTDYELSGPYIFSRIIGLPKQQFLFSSEDNAQRLYSKISYEYDAVGEFMVSQGAPVQHDANNYGASFVQGRGNVTSVRRWDVNHETDSAYSTVSRAGYNTTGSPIFSRDALNHQNTISYTDSFSPDGSTTTTLGFTTLAYPTTVTDAENYAATSKYNYDLGLVTRVTNPLGAAQTTQYDAAGRVKQLTNVVNGAYTRFVYPTTQTILNQFTTINDPTEAYWATVFDGVGRVRATASDLPNSTGHYSGSYTSYNNMGRAVLQTNPTEMNNTWTASGDDSIGWYSSSQTYDWQGRPLVTTNTDGTTKDASYGGCGCAGGAVVTLTDEGTIDDGVAKRRQQRIYSDPLGRIVKTEVLNWQGGSVYSTTINTYNALDQVTRVRQHQGTDTSTTYQDTTATFDGYGRLKTKHVPEQQVDTNDAASTDHTTWDYNTDDTIQKVTDARGASVTYSYNSRHLVTGITYNAPTVNFPGSLIPIPPTVNFDYDAARNRAWMNEGGQRRVTYHYDALSRMDWEDRQFPDLTGTFRLSYEYNLTGQVKKVTDQTSGTSFTTSFDSIGRISGVSGVGYLGSTPTFISSLGYRASGAAKTIAYGNNTNATINYDNRLRVSAYNVTGVNIPWTVPPMSVPIAASFQYHADGGLKFAQDQGSTNSIRDRAYQYDQAVRLTEAYSGGEARDFVNNTNGGPADGPYRQTFTFDVWNNPLSSGGRYWSRNSVTAQSFNQFSRNPTWTYDAEGNVIARESEVYWLQPADHTFDAAGNEVSVTQSSGCQTIVDQTNGQTFDGDGRSVKYVQSRSTSGPGSYTLVTYYLRSSVLGGRVVAEYDAQGVWRRTFVYAGDERVGELGKVEGGSAGFTTWRFQDAVTGDEMRTSAGGAYNYQSTYDPQGVAVPLADPFPPQGGEDECLTPDPGDTSGRGAGLFPIEDRAGCVLDGIEVPCSFVRSEAAAQCPDNNCGPRTRVDPATGQAFLVFFHAFADGYSGFLRPGSVYLGSGQYLSPSDYPDSEEDPLNRDSEIRRFAHAPQNPAQQPQDTRSPNQKACDDKIAGIFGGPGAVAATVAEPTTLLSSNRNRNPAAAYAHMAGNGVFHLYTNAQGTESTVGLYKPPGGRLVSGGQYDNGGQTENYFRFSYTRGPLAGVTISFVHVGGTHGGDAGGQYLGLFPGEPNRIGNIGGLGGGGFGYNHSHIKVYNKGKLTDPRKIFCKEFGF